MWVLALSTDRGKRGVDVVSMLGWPSFDSDNQLTIPPDSLMDVTLAIVATFVSSSFHQTQTPSSTRITMSALSIA